ncbi:hypothetical protein A374_03269 [Fictibacillus macauensis ZFHKF-1]|uniref:Uncharacterized protein n=1 Tax=Fictibacillus macauensis ZFHKF-1 TaxID=1196324 RepID=I8UIB3_9BACL|nr:hypothetical protein [Fictibacillus macauensis]EIT86558.1 hypothetical protein A374_03269 [Fictibacillus macauensis ZFHKF-1]
MSNDQSLPSRKEYHSRKKRSANKSNQEATEGAPKKRKASLSQWLLGLFLLLIIAAFTLKLWLPQLTKPLPEDGDSHSVHIES